MAHLRADHRHHCLALVEGPSGVISSGFAVADSDALAAAETELERCGFRVRRGDVPVGAGLSSSAALEVSTAFALASLSDHTIDKMTLARIGQAAEHKYGGVLSGLMDQFASAHGVGRRAGGSRAGRSAESVARAVRDSSIISRT